LTHSAEAGAYDPDHERLREIASYELQRGYHGGFLIYFLEAYLRADLANERLLRPIMLTFETKYRLTAGVHEETRANP
jgi:hypothetical protein